MGLDIIGVAYRIEKTFDVELSQEDLGSLLRDGDITAGDLYDLLLERMHLRDWGRYDLGLNFELWRNVRLLLHAVTQVPLEQIRLTTALETLFPSEGRRAAWDALRRASVYRMRELDYPPVVRWTGAGLAAVVVVVEQLQLWQMPWVRWFWPLAGFIGIWLFFETYAKLLTICARWRSCFPVGMSTVKDLCRAILAANYAAICSEVEARPPERSHAVWEQLRQILVDALGVDADEITFRSRLIRDLGLG